MRLIYIAIFGLLGVFSRYYMGMGISKVLSPPFPYGTFLINLVGAFLIGVTYVLGVERTSISEDVRVGLMVGYLGGFTTFSSYCLEVIRLVEDGEFAYAALYTTLSTLLGFGFAFLGIFLVRRLLAGGMP